MQQLEGEERVNCYHKQRTTVAAVVPHVNLNMLFLKVVFSLLTECSALIKQA